MRKLAWTLAAVLAAQALFVTSAIAQQALPPGNSGIDQYTENVPSAGGDKSSHGGGGGGAADGGGGGGSAQGGAPLSPQNQARLQRLGQNGAAAARAAQVSGPSAGETHQTGGDVPGSGGFGLWLPLFLVLSLLAAAAVVIARLRRQDPAA